MDMCQRTLKVYQDAAAATAAMDDSEKVGLYAPAKVLETGVGTTLRSKSFDKWSCQTVMVEGTMHVKHKNIDRKLLK